MCGFVVVLGRNGRTPDPRMVERMTAAIVHRGPDDSGFWSEGPVAMGFRRLSILDLSPSGHQPMLSPQGDAVLVYNGEIFNYIELRDELKALGHTFRSTGDTEVLLNAWRQWGEGCLEKLNGMFSFAIWDARAQELIAVRDRCGIKPLFLWEANDLLVLASEIKAIRASGLYQPRENWDTLARFAVHGRLDDTWDTSFLGIEQVPPGYILRARASGGVTRREYHRFSTDVLGEAPDAPQRVAELLENSVRLRMRSDVPLGVCLSGGLDSTSIICSMARERQRQGATAPLLAFCYGAEEFDETKYVQATLAQTGATYVPLQTDVNRLWSLLPTVTRFHDEPVHAMNVVIGYELMGLARQHGVIVVLNGQGADEMLGGYWRYYQDHWYTMMASGHPARAWREVSEFARAAGWGRTGLRAGVLGVAAGEALRKVPGFRALQGAVGRSKLRKHPWFAPELTDRSPASTVSTHQFGEVLEQSVREYPLPMYLRVEDRNSSAHGVEARVPFLDFDLVSYALRLPLEWKMRGQWNKYILREAMKSRIPEPVRTRFDKMGFPTPVGKWFAGTLYEPVRDLLGSRAARERGIFHSERLLRDLDAARGGEAPDAGVLFRAVSIEMWASQLNSNGKAPE